MKPHEEIHFNSLGENSKVVANSLIGLTRFMNGGYISPVYLRDTNSLFLAQSWIQDNAKKGSWGFDND